jgi:hypothetical protein
MCVPTGHDRASIAGLLIIASELSQSRNRFASQRRRLRDAEYRKTGRGLAIPSPSPNHDPAVAASLSAVWVVVTS